MSPLAGAAALALAVASALPLGAPRGRARAGDIPAVEPGASGELSATLMDTPQRGVPLELRLSSAHLKLADNRLGWSSVVDPLAVQPRLRTRFTAPEEPGRYTVEGTLSYLACDTDTCLPRVAVLRWSVEVVAPVVTEPDA